MLKAVLLWLKDGHTGLGTNHDVVVFDSEVCRLVRYRRSGLTLHLVTIRDAVHSRKNPFPNKLQHCVHFQPKPFVPLIDCRIYRPANFSVTRSDSQ
jgi:hypothetical protein